MATDRDKASGRFVKGNRAAAGNHYTRKAAEIRKALYSSVTAEDIKGIVTALKKQALNGDQKAAALLLDRLLGSITTGIDVLERMERIEAMLQAQQGGGDADNT